MTSQLNHNFLLIPPAGSGNKGDQAMLLGFISMLGLSNNFVILNPQEKDIWVNEIWQPNINLLEYGYSDDLLKDYLKKDFELIIFGADVIDSSNEDSIHRIKIIEIAIKFNSAIKVFFSFRSNVSEEIINRISIFSSYEKIDFFLRDYDSLDRFKKLFSDSKASFFPDLAFYCPSEDWKNPVWDRFIQDHSRPLTIGLNFSEHSFRQVFSEFNDENRLAFVESYIQGIENNFEKTTYVLFSNDLRISDNFMSDYDYAQLVNKVISKKYPTSPIFLVPSSINYAQTITLLNNIDIVITSRMHLSIAALRSGVLPIVIPGAHKKNSPSGLFDKASGLFKWFLGNSDFIAANIDEFNEKIKFISENLDDIKKTIKVRHLKLTNDIEEYSSNFISLYKSRPSSLNFIPLGFDFPNFLKNLSFRKFEDNRRIASLNDEVFKRGWWGLSLDREILDLKKSVLERDGKINDLNADISNRDTWRLKLDKEIINLNNEVFRRGEWGLRLDREIEGLNKKVDELNKEIVRRGEWGLNLNKELEAQKNKLNLILNSFSWRLTAPLRTMFAIVSSPIFYSKKIILKLLYFSAYIFNRLPINFKAKLLIKNFLLRHFAWLKNIQNNHHRILKDDPKKTFNLKHSSSGTADIESLKIKIDNIQIPNYSEPLVSIIIPIYGKVEYTVNCLFSISQHLPKNSFEIIVVDDLSPDNSAELLKGIKNIHIIKNKVNLGFLRSCNLGSEKANGKYLYFLNNDTQVTENWLDELIYIFKLFPKAGVVGSKLIYPDGSLQEAGGIFWDDASAWNYGRNQEQSLPEFNYVREVDYCSGASILISKKLFERVERFDEIYSPAYCEDADLCFKVRSAGYKTYYQPFSVIIHHEGISHGRDLNEGIKSYQVKNQKIFFDKWHDTLVNDHYPIGQELMKARDRSKYKKTVLVIDHYVPQFDKDAGSRTIYQWMKAFVGLGYIVKFWPDNLYYDPIYNKSLQEIGIEVLYGNIKFKDWIQSNSSVIDKVLLSRPHISINYIDQLRKYTQAKLIYYGHDIHYQRIQQESKYNPRSKELIKESKYWKDVEYEIWSKVDHIIYLSDVEIKYVNEHIRKKLLKSNTNKMPCFAYKESELKYQPNLFKRKDIMMVAGFAHRPNVDGVIWFVKNVFSEILKQDPNIHFYIIGSNPPESVKNHSSDRINVLGYISDQELEKYYQSCRVVVAPMLWGAGLKGKIVEAMSYGVPVVTTKVGAEGFDQEGAGLLVAKDANEFIKKIIMINGNDKSWQSSSKKELKYVHKHFSETVLFNSIKKLFK